jgi:thiol:disulfide interchange protein
MLFSIKSQLKAIVFSVIACLFCFCAQQINLNAKTPKIVKIITKDVTKVVTGTVKEAKHVTKQVVGAATYVPSKIASKFVDSFTIQTLKNIFLNKLPLWIVILAAFFFGILASLTPCIYPMIPITIGILNAQKKKTLLSNFLYSFSYVLGMAIVYASLGYVAATSTLIFGQWIANPIFIALIILVLLYFAFSMFGFYEIRIPQLFKSKKIKTQKGSVISTFVAGAVAGTVTSPCLTPALALLLTFVTKKGSPIIGFVTLFSFSLGMGMILILIGTFSGMLNALPRAGTWMNEVKKVFGFAMLGACVYFLKPIINYNLALFLYGIVVVIAVVYFGRKILKRITR